MLERKLIKLGVSKECVIPYDYAYALNCELYKKMSLMDKAFTENFHQNGFKTENEPRAFKLFTTAFDFNGAIFEQQHIRLTKKTEVNLIVSGHEKIVRMLASAFMQEDYINIHGAKMNVIEIKNERKKQLPSTSLYKVRTTVVESIIDDETQKSTMLDIMDVRYARALKQNLLRKYQLINEKEYMGPLELGIENIDTIKRRTINIKGAEIVGFANFNIFIQADEDMQQIAYQCGIGSHNAFGAGNLKFIVGE